jgi:hypothetical protein
VKSLTTQGKTGYWVRSLKLLSAVLKENKHTMLLMLLNAIINILPIQEEEIIII